MGPFDPSSNTLTSTLVKRGSFLSSSLSCRANGLAIRASGDTLARSTCQTANVTIMNGPIYFSAREMALIPLTLGSAEENATGLPSSAKTPGFTSRPYLPNFLRDHNFTVDLNGELLVFRSSFEDKCQNAFT